MSGNVGDIWVGEQARFQEGISQSQRVEITRKRQRFLGLGDRPVFSRGYLKLRVPVIFNGVYAMEKYTRDLGFETPRGRGAFDDIRFD